MPRKNRICKVCNQEFLAKGEFKGRIQKYCCKECWSKRNPRKKYVCIECRGSFESYDRSKVLCSRACQASNYKKRLEENSNRWRGDQAGYSAIHKFVVAKFGKPKLCINCGMPGKRMNWANISRRYIRDRSDWLELCAKCHKMFDMMSIENRKTFVTGRLWNGPNGKA